MYYKSTVEDRWSANKAGEKANYDSWPEDVCLRLLFPENVCLKLLTWGRMFEVTVPWDEYFASFVVVLLPDTASLAQLQTQVSLHTVFFTVRFDNM